MSEIPPEDNLPLDEENKPQKKSGNVVPPADENVKILSETVLSNLRTTTIVFPEVTVITFEQAKQKFDTEHNNRKMASAERKPVTQKILDIERLMKSKLEHPKNDIRRKFGNEEGKSRFNEFGIVKIGGIDTFPTNRPGKMNSLEMLVSALKKHEIDSFEYGITFWDKTKVDYKTLTELSTKARGDISKFKNTKKEARIELERQLKIIAGVLKTLYPKTYKEVYREWGFQKEIY
jgi:hypothetical protein